MTPEQLQAEQSEDYIARVLISDTVQDVGILAAAEPDERRIVAGMVRSWLRGWNTLGMFTCVSIDVYLSPVCLAPQ